MLKLLGESIFELMSNIGAFSLILIKVIKALPSPHWKFKQFAKQSEEIGVNSLIMVMVTSGFTGMVIAVQTLDQFMRFNAEAYIGGVIGLSMIREMAPVLTALVVAGRMGSAIAAEIGSMKITEQIDALRGFGVNPIAFIAVPKVLASMLMLPVLTIFADVVGILGGGAFVVMKGVSSFVYRRSLEVMLTPADILGGLLKAFFFGLCIAIASCSKGFSTKEGAHGVGEATTSAVVWSNMLVLAFNYILSILLFA